MKFFSWIILGLTAVVATMAPGVALADPNAGADLLGDLNNVLEGNIGIIIGLSVALLGLWVWLMEQNGWGIVMIVGGVLITAFPSLFDWFSGTIGDVSAVIEPTDLDANL